MSSCQWENVSDLFFQGFQSTDMFLLLKRKKRTANDLQRNVDVVLSVIKCYQMNEKNCSWNFVCHKSNWLFISELDIMTQCLFRPYIFSVPGHWVFIDPHLFIYPKFLILSYLQSCTPEKWSRGQFIWSLTLEFIFYCNGTKYNPAYFGSNFRIPFICSLSNLVYQHVVY